MLQVVCIKQVADTATRVKIAGDGKTLDPAGVTWILNPYDEYALEQALSTKEAVGEGEVVAICLGGSGATATIRNALAMGADRAIHLTSDEAAPDSLRVARALAAEIKTLSPQIVWFGRQAVDDEAAQVGPMVAELLDMPSVTSVAKFELAGNEATVEREIEGGREIVQVQLPAAFTADKGLNEPRYASLKGIMAAKKKSIEMKPAEMGDATLEIVALELPPERAAGKIVGEGPDAAAELVRLLREEAKVI